jgi:hypothetical protein
MRARIRIVAEAPDNAHLGHGNLIRPRITQSVDEKCSKVGRCSPSAREIGSGVYTFLGSTNVVAIRYW